MGLALVLLSLVLSQLAINSSRNYVQGVQAEQPRWFDQLVSRPSHLPHVIAQMVVHHYRILFTPVADERLDWSRRVALAFDGGSWLLFIMGVLVLATGR